MEYQPAIGIYLLNLITLQNNFQVHKKKKPSKRTFVQFLILLDKRCDTQFTVIYNRKQITTKNIKHAFLKLYSYQNL